MKVKVLKTIKYSGEYYHENDVVEVEEKYLNGLLSRGLVCKLEDNNIVEENVSDIEDDSDNLDEDNGNDDFCEINGINDDIAGALIDAGYKYYQDIVDASEKELTKISGIGKATAKTIKESASELV